MKATVDDALQTMQNQVGGALTGIENDFEQTVDGVIKTVRENRRELE